MNDLQSIFSTYGQEYRRVHRLPLNQLKAMASIESCRTIKLGGHIYKCECCGSIKLTYNSCRNRHCPKCQNLAKESWLQDRKRDLMSISYFHVVFTIPEEINNIVLRNQKVVYTLLFKAVSETLLQISRSPRFLGAEIGFTSILHTWTESHVPSPYSLCCYRRWPIL